MKRTFHFGISIVGLALAECFFWGFLGYFTVGSSGPPEKWRTEAVLGAGALYLFLLFFISTSTAKYPLGADFASKGWKNLKLSFLGLLLCFPAAFLFIGFIAPPFIVSASALALLRSAFYRPTMNDER
jgi:hypothetical protein